MPDSPVRSSPDVWQALFPKMPLFLPLKSKRSPYCPATLRFPLPPPALPSPLGSDGFFLTSVCLFFLTFFLSCFAQKSFVRDSFSLVPEVLPLRWVDRGSLRSLPFFPYILFLQREVARLLTRDDRPLSLDGIMGDANPPVFFFRWAFPISSLPFPHCRFFRGVCNLSVT